ncbi:MAG: hypothetical protein ACK5AY_10175 [Bacteroidota bacterium]|jgi:hypothetical protein
MFSELFIGKRRGISNFFRQFTTHLDTKAMTYKIQESVFGIFKWGEFEPLPKIEYVLVFKPLFAKCEPCNLDDFENNKDFYYQVSLVYNKSRRIVVNETRDRTEAFDLAKKLSLKFHKPIFDSATDRRNGVWIDSLK